MSKYIESYGKHALAVNQRHPKKAIREAILCFTYFGLIEKGLFHMYQNNILNDAILYSYTSIWPLA